MAAGLFTSLKVEIQFVTGKWQDVSGDVALEEGVQIVQGRIDESSDLSAATATFTLRNDSGAYTPNNPTSPYFPYVVEGRAVRVSVIRSATTYRRFTGTLFDLAPSFPTDDSSTGTVKITAGDTLAALGRRVMQTGFTEEALRLAKLSGTWADIYTFQRKKLSTNRAPTYLTNQGVNVAGSTVLGTGVFNPATYGYVSIDTADQLLVDNAAEFRPRAKYAVGPILKCVVGNAAAGVAPTPVRLDFFLKTPSSFTSGNDTYYIAHFWQTIGATTELFSIRLFEDASLIMHFGVYNAAGSKILEFLDPDGTNSDHVNDDTWRKMTVRWDGANTQFSYDDNQENGTAAFNFSLCDRIYFGGGMKPWKERSPFWVGPNSVAGIVITGVNNSVATAYATGTVTTVDSELRYYELLGYADAIVPQRLVTGLTWTSASTTVTAASAVFSSADVGAGIGVNSTAIVENATISTVNSPTSVTISVAALASGSGSLLVGPLQLGSDNRTVARVNTNDSSNLAEAFQVLARSCGGLMWCDPFGRTTLIYPDAINTVTSLVSVDLEDDLEADGLTLIRSAADVPTRVTVSGPIGDVTYIDTMTEAGLLSGQAYRKDTTVNAGAQNDSDALSLGGFYATQSHGLRIANIELDLVTAHADLYATFLTSGSLHPGTRLRGTNVPSTIFGATRADVVVQGWTETYDAASAIFKFDLTPADDPVQGTWDDTEFGRWASSLSLCLAYPITSGATAIVVAANDNSGIGVTTSAGDYPLDLDIFGERVTVAGVPGSLARTNLCTNPSFEVNTTGWAGAASATITRVSTLRSVIDGNVSGQITWPTTTALTASVGYATAVTSGQTYTFSVYVYVPSGQPRVQVGELAGSGSGVSYFLQDTTGFNDGWVRLGVTLTATATTTYTFVLRNLDASTSGQVAFIDAALLENTTRGVGSYFDGGNMGGAWTGTADASTSTQTAQTFTVTRGTTPTVARAHIPGELVDAYHSMAWTI